MKIVELKDNYLINIGGSLEDKYTYIPNIEHDFATKELSRESIQIHGLSIPFERNIANNSVLHNVLYDAGNSYISTVNGAIDSAPNKSGKSLENICSVAFSGGKTYFSDYLKYFAKEIKMNEVNYHLLMSLVDSHIVKLGEQIMAIRQGHNASISKAEDNASRGAIESNLHTIAEINNAPKIGYSTTYANPSMFGDGVNAYTYGTSFSPMTQNELKAAEMGASMLANFEIQFASESAYDNAVSSFKSFIQDLVHNFCNKTTELFYVKYAELFSPSINNANDLTVNPLNVKTWVSFVDSVPVEEYPKLKTILDYYHLNICTNLGFKLRDNIIKHYDDKRTCDYNGNDLKVYLYLNNIQTPKQSNYLSTRFYVHSLNVLLAAHKAHKPDHAISAKHAEKSLADARRYAHECDYLSESDLKKFDENYNLLLDSLKREYKDNKHEVLTGLIGNIVLLAIIGGIIWFIIKSAS